MRRIQPIVFREGLFIIGLMAMCVAAQEQPSTEQPEAAEKPSVVAKEPPAPSVPGPKLLNLRYDEDFRYLDGEPGSYREDAFDPIKNIRLGGGWRLDLGGEFRFRLEAETNKAFGAGRPTQDTFLLHRVFLHADLKYRNVARVFLQGVNAMIEDWIRARPEQWLWLHRRWPE